MLVNQSSMKSMLKPSITHIHMSVSKFTHILATLKLANCAILGSFSWVQTKGMAKQELDACKL